MAVFRIRAPDFFCWGFIVMRLDRGLNGQIPWNLHHLLRFSARVVRQIARSADLLHVERATLLTSPQPNGATLFLEALTAQTMIGF